MVGSTRTTAKRGKQAASFARGEAVFALSLIGGLISLLVAPLILHRQPNNQDVEPAQDDTHPPNR